MKTVLIVKNCSREGPGLIENLLKEFQIPFLLRDLEQGESFPSPKEFGALIVLGGPQSANGPDQIIHHALKRIEEALALNIPYFGICLGMQMLVKAGGGKVVKNRVGEIGFRDPEGKFFEVSLTDEGMQDLLLKDLPNPFKIFHLHGETVRTTPKMALLGTGKYCNNQIVKAGPLAYGIQGHVELTEELFKVWMREDPDLLALSTSSLNKDYRSVQDELFETGIKLFTNFIRIANG